jgi:hypothetical protein
MISQAFQQLAEAIEPLGETELYFLVSQLVSQMLLRLRLAVGAYKCSSIAIDHLL